MQLDMHYYGTYAMARAAGINPDACQVIATAAQFVDDNAGSETVIFGDGARLDVDATAHHAKDISNLEDGDQRRVWVPFHFLPGNEGDSYTERLICRKDSAIAQQLVEHTLTLTSKPYAVEAIGILAHVYADTFSHYGFSGVSSRRNLVDQGSFKFEDLEVNIEQYILDKASNFWEKYKEENQTLSNVKAWFAEIGSAGLGHGGVATFPDRPYLKWSFYREHPEHVIEERNNYQTFQEGCAALHGLFRNFANARPELKADDGRDFSEIEDTVKKVLATQANCEGRILAWKTAAKDGALFKSGVEEIPTYDGEAWHQQRDAWHGNDGDGLANSGEASETPIYRFYQAAAAHRTFVLRDLLPSHGIVVD